MRIIALILSFAFVFSCGIVKKPVKYIALTFDDGPHPVYTARILKILYDNNASATFFVIGENAERYPSLIRAEYDSGHELGNHTYSHGRLNEKSVKTLYNEIKKTDGIIKSITGEEPVLFRPPEGATSKIVLNCAERFSYPVILWSIDTKDWERKDAGKIADSVLSGIKPGAIILMPEFVGTNSQTPQALRKILPALLEQGYEFVTVSELLGLT